MILLQNIFIFSFLDFPDTDSRSLFNEGTWEFDVSELKGAFPGAAPQPQTFKTIK